MNAIDPHISEIDRQGFTLFHNMADTALLAALRRRVDELVEEEGSEAAKEHHKEEGCHRLADLVNKDSLFDQVWLQADILAVMAAHFARPFKLSSLNSREALLGGGHQPLHQDWKQSRPNPPPVEVMNALWALDDVGPLNGAPRVVPGTHRLGELPAQLLSDPAAKHPDEIVVELPAGSVVLIDAHCWHGGTTNVSGQRRRILHSYFTARERTPQQDQGKLLRPATRKRLSEEHLRLLLGT